MAQSQQTETQVFAGGINTRISSHLIDKSEATELSNSDIRRGTLLSRKLHAIDEEHTNPFFYYFNSAYYYYNSFRSNVLWNGVYYWSDAFTTGKVLADGTELPLGLAPPVNRLTVTAAAPLEEGLTGKYIYVYTYYDRITGVESPPSPPSHSIRLDNKAAVITGFTSAPTVQDYELRLYRVGEGVTVFTSVITLGADYTTYSDELLFSELEANLLTTIRAFPPVPQLQNLTESRGRFYGSVGTQLVWSALGKPDSWYNLDAMSFPTEIVLVKAVANGLLVATAQSTWLVSGDIPIRFTRHLISASEGCLSNQSVAVYNGTAIWLSNDGIVSSNGMSLQDITLPKLDRLLGLDPLAAAVHDSTYYLAYTEQMFPSDDLFPSDLLYPANIESKNEFATGMYVIDFSFGTPIITYSYQSDIGYVDVAGNNLDQIIFDGNANSRLHMFVGDNFQELIYKSPLHTEGSYGVEKQFEKARIVFIGEFTITLLDQAGNEFASTTVKSDFITSEWIGISPKKNRGYGIQYHVEGKGEILSLSHVWTPREVQ